MIKLMKISFHGADQNVTGSKHLIESENYKLLLDCGMHQGKRSVAEKLNRDLPFNATEINAVIISHGHLDHCGMLPILVREGFRGKIYCTAATAEIAMLIMLDAAKIQEQDAAYLNRQLPEGGVPIIPLYTILDAQMVQSYFEIVPYFRDSPEWVQLNSRIRFKFYDAGHILGSAITYLEIREIVNGAEKLHTFGFTGDLGHGGVPILRSPENIQENCATLLMEATYGNKIHRPFENAAKELRDIINDAYKKQSKVLIPAFALGRTQEIIYILHRLSDNKEIPAIPIFVDSPLSSKLAQVYEKHYENYNKKADTDFLNKHEQPLEFNNLHYTESVPDSKAINDIRGCAIIVASSGMMEGGRIVHHLKKHIGHADDYILITGYQAEDTLGRRIQDGMTPVRILGDYYPVRAKICTLNEFSAHADQIGLLDFVEKPPGLKEAFLVHTELPQAMAFKELVHAKDPTLRIEIPSIDQSFVIEN